MFAVQIYGGMDAGSFEGHFLNVIRSNLIQTVFKPKQQCRIVLEDFQTEVKPQPSDQLERKRSKGQKVKSVPKTQPSLRLVWIRGAIKLPTSSLSTYCHPHL